jgi:hypothetical protein
MMLEGHASLALTWDTRPDRVIGSAAARGMEASMGRLIIGATAIVTGLAAALGMVVRRRRARRDDQLRPDQAPLGSSAPAQSEVDEVPSVEVDFGPVSDPPAVATASPAATTRKPRSPRKASTSKSPTAKRTTADQPAASAVRPKRPTRVRTTQAPTVAESIPPTDGEGVGPPDGS